MGKGTQISPRGEEMDGGGAFFRVKSEKAQLFP
jgi:hypothetical protein